MINLVIWDFDGPLFDSRTARNAALSALHSEHKSQLGNMVITPEDYPLTSPEDTLRDAFPSIVEDMSAQTHFAQVFRDKLSSLELKSRLSGNVKSLVKELHDRGIKQAIVSMRSESGLRQLLTKFSILGAFSEVVGRDSGFEQKPSPEPIVHIISKMFALPTNTVFLGDTRSDEIAANAAGVRYVHCAWSSEPALVKNPDFRAETPQDISHILFESRIPLEDGGSLRSKLLSEVDQDFSFFCGAGVSVPSGIGGWEDTYSPILSKYLPQSLLRQYSLPELIDFICTTSDGRRRVYEDFEAEFSKPRRENEYHMSMVRSSARTVWTTNYDLFCERAAANSGNHFNEIRSDRDLVQYFGRGRSIVKINGDFPHSRFQENSLEWDIVLSEEQFDRSEVERPEIWRFFEDEYRTSRLIFVGLSFADPTLKRILTKVSRNTMRNRNRHYVLSRLPKTLEEGFIASKFASVLASRGLDTVFFEKHSEILHFVTQLSIRSRQPIVGFSGSLYQVNNEGTIANPEVLSSRLTGGVLPIGELEEIIGRIGSRLATSGYRVVSGHGQGVGVPAVLSAYRERMAGRFIMRERGHTRGTRGAPVIAVAETDMNSTRSALAGVSALMIAMGGSRGVGVESGTVVEAMMAIEKGRPVILLSAGGGDVRNSYDTLMNATEEHISEPSLRRKLIEINRCIYEMNAEEFREFSSHQLDVSIQELLHMMVGSAMTSAFDEACRAADQIWN